jgi:FdhD protein
MAKAVISVPGVSVGAEGARGVSRALPEEWPVALVYDGSTQAVMMCSPQDLSDFALGFSLTEGFVGSATDIVDFELVEHESGSEARFWLVPERAGAVAKRRRAMAGPVGCGLCGIDSLQEAVRELPSVAPGGPVFSHADVLAAVGDLRGHQPLHDLTHAVHAAGFARPGAGLAMVREDVGRHNALDKLIGALSGAGIDPASGAFVMTSRLSVELVQKAAMVGCPVIIAVSAPTAHAVRLAEGAGITLVAFARGAGFDVYAHGARILHGASDVA